MKIKAYSALLLMLLTPLSLYAYSEQIGINTERWLLAGKDKLQRSLYVDSETIEKNIVSNQSESFSLVYSFWLKTAAFNGATTPAEKVTIDCSSRTYDTNEIIPESKEEVLYKYFCKSTDAQNTFFPKTATEIEEERQQRIIEQEQKDAEFRRKQMAVWDQQIKASQAQEAERLRQMQENAWRQAAINNQPSRSSITPGIGLVGGAAILRSLLPVK